MLPIPGRERAFRDLSGFTYYRRSQWVDGSETFACAIRKDCNHCVVGKRTPDGHIDVTRIAMTEHLDQLPSSTVGAGGGLVKCGKVSCSLCARVDEAPSFCWNGVVHVLPNGFAASCMTRRAIYLLRFPCERSYVGQTSTRLKERFAGHKRGQYSKDSKMAEHRRSCVKCIAGGFKFKVRVLEIVDDPDLLRPTEARWIAELGTYDPPHLNDH